MQADPTYALALAVIVAAVYLVVLRLLDLNEKEPLWALGFVLLCGAVAAGLADVVVDDRFRVLDRWGNAVTTGVATFLALAAAVAALEGIGRLRGWSELNGLLDGIVYGAAAGLGFAVGEVFVRELVTGTSLLESARTDVGSGTVLWSTLLDGLAHGAFGAIIGAGFGVAVGARNVARAVIPPVLALLAALLVQVAWSAAAGQYGVGDTAAGDLRSWLMLMLPLALVAAAIAYGLAMEGKAIAGELADEQRSGTVTAEEIALLRSPGARRAAYWRSVTRGDLAGWVELRTLHNRQVQLALTERRLRGASDPEHRAELEQEVARLRGAVLDARHSAQQGVGPVEGAA